MKDKLSLRHSLECLSSLFAVVASAGVLQAFIIGKHYVIPTLILFVVVIFGNLARYGFRNFAWAKQILFWIFFVLAVHAFFALFWAAKPRELLGSAFLFVYGGFLLLIAGLLVPYARLNRLFATDADSGSPTHN